MRPFSGRPHWLILPRVARGNLSIFGSSLLVVYSSRQSPAKSSGADKGSGVGFLSSTRAITLAITCRSVGVAVMPRFLDAIAFLKSVLLSISSAPFAGENNRKKNRWIRRNICQRLTLFPIRCN